ncbi:MAG TPA: ABC transporter permease [Gammaproteobacteria bacterium]|nr:ABC transporter permease [Gammaproteobacteria bacterium]
METLLRDFLQALRTLRKSPVFAATVVLTLALGIGATTSIFSVFDTVVLAPVPFADADRLVQLVGLVNGQPNDTAVSAPIYRHLRAQTDVIEDVGAYRAVWANYSSGDVRERLAVSQVTEPYFRTFRASMALGRPFAPEEDVPGAAKTAVVSYGFWMTRLGGNPDVIGSTILLNGIPHTVVGVTSDAFDTHELGRIDLWVPLQAPITGTDGGAWFQAAARLRSGVTLQQAQARLEASTASLDRAALALSDNVRFSAVPFKDALIATESSTLFRNDPRGVLWTLFGAVGCVLLIGCANVANLMLVRASAREREIAVRAALGAGRWHIARQLLTESVILSAIGGALGLAAGYAGIRTLSAVSTAGLSRLGERGALLGIDWRVVAFTVSVSVLTLILSGLLPALIMSRADPNAVIRQGTGYGATGRRHWSRSILVVAEIALAVVLLIGSGLLIETIVALNSTDPGINVDDVVVMRTLLSEERFLAATRARDVVQSTLERIRAIPGVSAAGATCCVPLQRAWGEVFKIAGRDDGARPFTSGGEVTISTGDYFDVFQVPVVRGRAFGERDDASSTPVIVINRALADRWWPNGQDPIGQKIRIGGGHDEPEREVIGVVENVRQARLELVRQTVYVPFAQISGTWLRTLLPGDSLAWIVRTKTDPLGVAAAVRDEIQRDTAVPVTEVAAMKSIVADSIARQRANMLLMNVFGAVALLLAAVGVYGLVAYSVRERTREIGIRMALGAPGERIVSLVLREGFVLVVAGIALGLTAAFFLAGLIGSLLYGVDPRNVAVFAGVPIVLALVALAAAAIPAYRASRVDPLEALRCE